MIEDMKRRAARVKAEHDGLERAKLDKRAAMIELLRAVVEAVAPALPALCSRILGIPGPALRALNVGHCLYLGEKGGWIELRDGGALILARTDEHVDEHFVVEDVVEEISQALTKQAGAREWMTAEIRHEAERLRAAVLLLRPVPR
jgi:hypothetical protein